MEQKFFGKVGLLMCTRGSMDVMVNDEYYHFCEGMIRVISPLAVTVCISQTEDYEEVAMLDTSDVFFQSSEQIFSLVLRVRHRNRLCLELDEVQRAMFLQRVTEVDARRVMMREAISQEEVELLRRMVHLLEQETLCEFLHLTYRRFVDVVKPVTHRESIAFRFLYSLQINSSHERSVAFYAKEANLSPGHFTVTVKDVTGRTPSVWIASSVIVHAKMLLMQKDKSIKEIARALGFPEQFTFRKFFKHHVGLSPKEYRKQIESQIQK